MSGSELVGLADRLDVLLVEWRTRMPEWAPDSSRILMREYCADQLEHRIATELRALAARLPGDGWVMVPKSALEWLDGMGEDFECPPDLYFNGKPAPYWWREEFRRRAAASPAAGIGGSDAND